MTKSIIKQIEKDIQNITGCNKPQVERRYHKHDQYVCYGMKTSDFHKLMKEYHSRFLEFSLSERLELAVKLLETRIGELGHTGIYIFAISTKQLTPEHFSLLDKAADEFTSWTYVDVLSTKVTPVLLFNYPKQMLDFLDKWNHSENRFKRRASVVTFIQNVAKSGKFLDDALRLCENLIWDNEDIVRKGVGWTLKVNMDYARDRVLEYVKDLRRRGVPSTITLYAIEKLPKELRAEVLKIKKE